MYALVFILVGRIKHSKCMPVLSFVPAKCWFDSRITQIPVSKIQRVSFLIVLLAPFLLFFLAVVVVVVVVGVEDKQPPPYGTDMG